jgi:hypothetical protein
VSSVPIRPTTVRSVSRDTRYSRRDVRNASIKTASNVIKITVDANCVKMALELLLPAVKNARMLTVEDVLRNILFVTNAKQAIASTVTESVSPLQSSFEVYDCEYCYYALTV